MRSHVEGDALLKNRRLADLRQRALDLERELSDARLSLEREAAGAARPRGHARPHHRDPRCPAHESVGWAHDRRGAPAAAGGPAGGRAGPGPDPAPLRGRTDMFVAQGRSNAFHRRPRRWWMGLLAGAAAAALIITAVVGLSGGGPAWPGSVARMQREAARACENPDVQSEPAQVNFACAKGSRQILWVFALMTSGGNPRFADRLTSRRGLEPITPAQGGAIAWSLNLHHPYNPLSPVDSLQVAARAINNIIGGATLVGPHGKLLVQPGLESSRGNCLRYTGSAKLKLRAGYPAVCARPVNGRPGQAALVADVYQRWVVGASPRAARNAAILFARAQDPGNPQVQAILRHLPR